MKGNWTGKTIFRILCIVVSMAVLAFFLPVDRTVQAGTVVSDTLKLDGMSGKVVDNVFDSGCKVIGGTTYNLAKTFYDSATQVIDLLTGNHSTADAALGWIEVGLNMAGAGAIIAAIVTGSATLPAIAAITFGVAFGKTLVSGIRSAIKNGDQIMSWLKKYIGDPLKSFLGVYKPNIYIYCDREQEVKVRLKPFEFITESVPAYQPEEGWNVHIYKGSINGCNDFLFYEAKVPDRKFQRQKGFVVRQDTLKSDMELIMKMYGFNRKETDDFTDYWTGRLEGTDDYVFYPQETDIVEDIMPIAVDPEPDSIFRLWFLIEPSQGKDFEKIIHVRGIERTGLTVVEWGGVTMSNVGKVD